VIVDINLKRVKIIAEIGSNHNGELDTALRLIATAAASGADIAKFQSFLVDELLASEDPNYARLAKLQLPREWYPKLIRACHDHGLEFLSTATNFTTLEWMEELGVWGYKIASCNITHWPLLQRLAAIGKPLIVSTGLATLEEVQALDTFFQAEGLKEYAFLHCVSKYPVEPAALRLKNLVVLKEVLSCPVGFSDHSEGAHMAAAAVALGARIVEKHISLDKTGLGLDHEVAVLPDQFKAMCQAIRSVEEAMFADFTPDQENIFRMRRSLHFARSMRRGEAVTATDIKIVRPEDGLPPKQFTAVLGQRLIADVAAGEPARACHFDPEAGLDASRGFNIAARANHAQAQ
jgi:sialic acid synthase SpsE